MSDATPIRKARSDAKLKNLPEDRQEDIVKYVREPHSLKDTLAWLKEDGVETSLGALSEFLSWWELRQQMRKNHAAALQVVEQLQQNSNLTPKQIEDAGQAFFTAMALQQQDLKGWFFMQQLNLKKDQLKLDRQKFRRDTAELLIEYCQDEEVKRIALSNAPKEEKIEQMGLRIFGKDWEDGK